MDFSRRPQNRDTSTSIDRERNRIHTYFRGFLDREGALRLKEAYLAPFA